MEGDYGGLPRTLAEGKFTEAAKACELLKVKTVIPIHFGTFPPLTGTPDALRSECAARGVDVEVLEIPPGESVG